MSLQYLLSSYFKNRKQHDLINYELKRETLTLWCYFCKRPYLLDNPRSLINQIKYLTIFGSGDMVSWLVTQKSMKKY